MGLCKCPKRKTTSHFCFHHCVNVCEHCIVNNHTTCVVKSYTTWLKEASGSVSSSSVSASALCAVCQKQFSVTQKEIENSTNNFNTSSCNPKTAIRLLCYHVVHAHCLSIYVKKQLKEGNVLKCPSCARLLWVQLQEQQDPNDTSGINSIELSPVTLQLYKHLLNNGNWWGQALIKNETVNDIEKHLLDDKNDFEEFEDYESQLEDQTTLQIKSQANIVLNNMTSLTPTPLVQTSNTSINLRNNVVPAYQPIHQRHFNNNYGIESAFTTQLQQQQQQMQQQQQCLSVNMTNISQSSDLSNRHTLTSSTSLLLNNDNNVNHDEEQQDPSGKYRPKKFNNQSWFFNYQQLVHYCFGANRTDGQNSLKMVVIIILCLFVITFLLVVITSYTRYSDEPFDHDSIDYGGGGDHDINSDGTAHIKSYNINNL